MQCRDLLCCSGSHIARVMWEEHPLPRKIILLLSSKMAPLLVSYCFFSHSQITGKGGAEYDGLLRCLEKKFHLFMTNSIVRAEGKGGRHLQEGKKIRMKTSWDHAVCLPRRGWLKQSLGKQIGLLLKCCWILLLWVKQRHFKFSASLHFHFLVLCNQSSFSFPHSPLCSRTNQYWSRLHQLIEGNTCLLFWLRTKPQDLFYQFIQVGCLTASSKNTNK